MRTGELREEITVSVLQANVYSMLLVAPPVAVLGMLYVVVWGAGTLMVTLLLAPLQLLIAVAVMVSGIAVHELLHGITWSLAGKKPLSAVEFGVLWKALTPYAHCKVPLAIGAYRAGVVMPGVLLGLLPMVVALLTGAGWAMLFGMFFALAAGGDFLMMLLTRKVRAGDLVEDHPTKLGCYVSSSGSTDPQSASV